MPTTIYPKLRKQLLEAIVFIDQNVGQKGWHGEGEDAACFYRWLFKKVDESEWYDKRDFSYWVSADRVAGFMNAYFADKVKVNLKGKAAAVERRMSGPDPLLKPLQPTQSEPLLTPEQQTVLGLVTKGCGDEASISALTGIPSRTVGGVLIEMMRRNQVVKSPSGWEPSPAYRSPRPAPTDRLTNLRNCI